MKHLLIQIWRFIRSRCPKCGAKLMRWSDNRYDCTNGECRYKLYAR